MVRGDEADARGGARYNYRLALHGAM
jgi:hypothetical protein